MPTSTRWRLNITARNGTSYVELSMLKMAATPGGTDLCTGGTAVASSVYGAGYEAAKAFDGNAATQWASTGSPTFPVTLEYTFPSAVEVTQYTLQADTEGPYAPKDWTLEYWDGAAWQVTDTQTNQTGWYLNELRTFPMINKLRWRLHITASIAGTYSVLAEVQLRTAAAGANQATVGLRASANTGANANRAIDGNAATSWSSTSSSFPNWWMYWSETALNVVEYVIQAAPATDHQYAPKTWTLEYWDGAAWVAADTRTDQAAWSAGETRTFTVTLAPAAVERATLQLLVPV